jgi:tetratricopeptide (TPR) repeat protein
MKKIIRSLFLLSITYPYASSSVINQEDKLFSEMTNQDDLSTADTYFNEGKYKEAFKIYEQFFKQDSSNVHVFYQLAECYNAHKQYKNAINFYFRAIVCNNTENTYAQKALDQIKDLYSKDKENYQININSAISFFKKKYMYNNPRFSIAISLALFEIIKNNDLEAEDYKKISTLLTAHYVRCGVLLFKNSQNNDFFLYRALYETAYSMILEALKTQSLTKSIYSCINKFYTQCQSIKKDFTDEKVETLIKIIKENGQEKGLEIFKEKIIN